jgi:predicted dehydrogenase
VDIGVPQVVTITGRLANGALAIERHLGLATDTSTPVDRLTIWGLEGTIRYEFGNTIELAHAGQALSTAAVPPELQRSWQVERDFVDAVRAAKAGVPGQARRVSPDFQEGLEYMRKVEAVHRSAASGRTVTLSDL